MGSTHRWLLAALVLQFCVFAGYEASHDSITVDEAFDVANGVTTVVKTDTRFLNEHGLLPRVVDALPVLATDVVVPEADGFRSGDWFQQTADFLHANEGDLGRIAWLSRLVPIAITVAAGLGIHRLALLLHGPEAGMFAAAAWFTTPFVVGLGHLATIDVPFAAAVVWCSVAVLRHLRAPTDRTAALIGVALGAALLTRHLGIVVVASALLAMVLGVRGDRRTTARHLGLALAVPFVLVWVAYRLVDPGGGGDPQLAGIIAAGRDDLLTRVVLLVPWPQEWSAGFAYLTLTSEPRPAFLLGRSWVGSRIWFFPGSALVKLPATLLLLVVGGSAAAARRSVPRREASLVLVLPMAVLGLALLAQPLNLGLRYAVPILALAFVLASPVVGVLRGTAGRAVLGGALAVQLVACWVAVPHSLAWTPPPFTDGYRWASDSNLDYGQDLDRLERWEHIDGSLVSVVTARGLPRPEGSRDLLDVAPEEVRGWVAVGATSLTVVHRDELSWLRAYCSVGTIGGSIVLYEFVEAPDGAPGPSQPAGPCNGTSSVRGGR